MTQPDSPDKSAPRALDLFCGAGGAAMGLHRAGFDVVGVDIKPQPRYPFEFHQSDAMTFPLEGFDFIWASPPCQGFCDLKGMYNAKHHDDLLTPTRERLIASGIPYVIENVPGSPLAAGSLKLCGTMFRLGTMSAELRRHRYFEATKHIISPPCDHGRFERVIGVYGGHGRDRRRKTNMQDFSTEDRREAMGIDWMTGNELSQAIPPAYSEFIARQFLETWRDRNSPTGVGAQSLGGDTAHLVPPVTAVSERQRAREWMLAQGATWVHEDADMVNMLAAYRREGVREALQWADEQCNELHKQYNERGNVFGRIAASCISVRISERLRELEGADQ